MATHSLLVVFVGEANRLINLPNATRDNFDQAMVSLKNACACRNIRPDLVSELDGFMQEIRLDRAKRFPR